MRRISAPLLWHLPQLPPTHPPTHPPAFVISSRHSIISNFSSLRRSGCKGEGAQGMCTQGQLNSTSIGGSSGSGGRQRGRGRQRIEETRHQGAPRTSLPLYCFSHFSSSESRSYSTRMGSSYPTPPAVQRRCGGASGHMWSRVAQGVVVTHPPTLQFSVGAAVVQEQVWGRVIDARGVVAASRPPLLAVDVEQTSTRGAEMRPTPCRQLMSTNVELPPLAC